MSFRIQRKASFLFPDDNYLTRLAHFLNAIACHLLKWLIYGVSQESTLTIFILKLEEYRHSTIDGAMMNLLLYDDTDMMIIFPSSTDVCTTLVYYKFWDEAWD